MEKLFRVVCSTDTAKENANTIVDIAAANFEDAQLTHYQLFKLRQYETPKAQQILPPLNLKDNDGTITLAFDKPERATAEDNKKLQEYGSRIKLEYQKFKYQNKNSTIELTDENFACAYDFVDTNASPSSSKEAELFQRINRSRAIQAAKTSGKTEYTRRRMTLQERLARYSGD